MDSRTIRHLAILALHIAITIALCNGVAFVANYSPIVATIVLASGIGAVTYSFDNNIRN
jgi:hypothetical protein